MSLPFERWLRLFLYAVLAGALAVGVLDVLHRLYFEFQGPLENDADIYFTVGRGLLNGLTPYRDLFENKPPGIFLLTALSLAATDGPYLANLLQIIALLSILAAPVTGIWLRRKEFPDYLIQGCMILLGIILMLFTALYAGKIQVESFGLAFAIWYPVLIDVRAGRWNKWWGLLAALLMFGSIGFKEPFALTLLASAVVLCHDRKMFVQTFLIPLGITAITGVLLLLVLGWLPPYLMYLAFMLSDHIPRVGPVWMRGFEVWGMLMYFMRYSHFLAESMLLPWLILFYSIVREREAGNQRWFILLRLLVALYLMALSVGLGGYYYSHHYLFPFPAYLAIFILAFHALGSLSDRLRQMGIVAFTLLLAGATVLHFRLDHARELEESRQEHAANIHVAQAVDSVLDRCGFDRYLHLVNKGGGPYGWTRHSPSGPAFLLYTRFILPHDNLGKRLANERVILLKSGSEHDTGLKDLATDYIRQHYRQEAWPCAGAFSQPESYFILFRNMEDLTQEERTRVLRPPR